MAFNAEAHSPTMKFISIVDDGDLQSTVKGYKLPDDKVAASGSKFADDFCFQVKKSILMNVSMPLKAMLGPNFSEGRLGSPIVLEGVRRQAMELVLRVLRGTTTNKTNSVHLKVIWYTASICDMYSIDVKLFQGWFKGWYRDCKSSIYTCESKIHDPQECRVPSVLYPSWLFDHAEAFTRATKHVVYESEGHIIENNPTTARHLYMPPRIAQQLNFVKGRIRNVFRRKLFDAIEPLFKASCTCKEKTVFAYQKELIRINVWPPEKLSPQTPLLKILERVDGFDYKYDGSCSNCMKSYKGLVILARDKALEYFDGLCLDCMDHSNPKMDDDTDDVYWEHNKLRKWDLRCRTSHGEPTWYYSYMGRKETQNLKLRKEREERRRSGYDGD